MLGRFHVALGVYALHLDLLRDLSGLSPSEPHLQIGSSTIAPTDFRAFLAREISKRPPDWPVYIEADPNLEYESVARTESSQGRHHCRHPLSRGTRCGAVETIGSTIAAATVGKRS